MMDNIIVWGSTMHEHNQRLQEVFAASRKAYLKLNREKCVFGVSELTFVGDTISAEGIKPDVAKVKAIRDTAKQERYTTLLGHGELSGEICARLIVENSNIAQSDRGQERVRVECR